MNDLGEPVTTISQVQATSEDEVDDMQTGRPVDDERTKLLNVGDWTVVYRGERLSDELSHAIEKFPEGWEELERPNSYAWNQDGNPKYFVKDRPMIQALLHLKRQGTPTRGGYLSVGLELALSQRISDVLEQASVQEFVKGKRFKGIRYIEPLCALIPVPKPELARKCVMYPFVQEAVNVFSRGDDLSEICEFLKIRLREAGINPEDLRPRQFIIDAEGMLWLIDTEGYEPISAKGKDD